MEGGEAMIKYINEDTLVVSKSALRKDFLAAVLLIGIVALVVQFPELRRYMKIRSM